MKKIYVVLLMSLLLGFVAGSKAKGQDCSKCPPNTVCIPLTFDVGSCDNVRITLCVRCGVSNPSIYVFAVTFENVCPGYEDQILAYLNNWVKDNILLICGSRPCQEEPPFKVYFHKPLCGDVFWDGYRLQIYDAGAGCQNYCLDEREWCYCNCVPGECYDQDCNDVNLGHFRYNHIRYEETNPAACNFFPYGNCDGADEKWKCNDGDPWKETLHCVRILWDYRNCDSECSD